MGKDKEADAHRYRQQQEPQQRQQQEQEPMRTKPEQLQQFEQYAQAVNADRYRVTSIKMREDGSKQTFILDKRDGVTRGFTPAEIAQRTPEMQRLQRRGENLYYTPLSDTRHHILIDDMSRDKLDKLIKDGYKPAAVIESSPGNYQAIITVPKLGTEHDKAVGNRLSDALNREYGDPKLSGAIHPHRAPGYENRKPKHMREDGTYPPVRLLRAERRDCARTLALSQQINAEHEQRAQQAQQKPQKALQRDFAPQVGLDSAGVGKAQQRAYRGHHADIVRRYPDADLSRVDSMIAVRMRMTGHSSDDIRSTIEHCAPQARPPEQQSRDWQDYARRTAAAAETPRAEQQIEQLSKHKEQVWKCEGRDYGKEMQQQRELELEMQREREMERSRSRGMGMGM